MPTTTTTSDKFQENVTSCAVPVSRPDGSAYWGVVKPIVGSDKHVPYGNESVKCPAPRPNRVEDHRHSFERLTPYECFHNTQNYSDIGWLWWLFDRSQEPYELSRERRLFPPDPGFPEVLWQSGLQGQWPGLWWQRLYTSQGLALQRFIKRLFEESSAVSDGWVPKQPLIDWSTENLSAWAAWASGKLPAALVLPKWWRKEYGSRWDWDPTKWISVPNGPSCIGHEYGHQNCDFCSSVRRYAELAAQPQVLQTDGCFWSQQPFRFRPARFEGMSKTERGTQLIVPARGQARQRIKVVSLNAGLNSEALDDRAMSFMWWSPFSNQRSLKSFIMNRSSEQLGPDLDRLDKALAILIPQAAPIDTSIYESTQKISTGNFTSPSTSSALAHSTRWLGDPPPLLPGRAICTAAEYEQWKRKPKPPEWKWKDFDNRRKQLWGCNDSEPNEDFHDRITHQATLLPKPKTLRECVEVVADGLTFYVSAERDDELAAKFEARAEEIKAQRREHDERVKAEEKKPSEFSEALMDKWNARLAKEAADAEAAFTPDKQLGIEHTGLENLKNEELRSLQYRKSRAIPRYKNELVSDLDKEQDEDAEELPDEDAVPDEDEAVSDVEDVAPEDDDLDPDNEESEAFSDSGSETSEGTCYINDSRFSDDEDAVGPPEGHDHLIPDYEDNLRKTHEDRQYTHEELEYVRRHAERVKKDPKRRHIPSIALEVICRNRTIEEALELCGVEEKPKTAQRQVERFVAEAEMHKDSSNGTPYVEISDEILDDIKAGSAYVKLDLDNGWKYHRLDTETYATLDEAVLALKEKKIAAAWAESAVRKKTEGRGKRRGDFVIKNREVRRQELQKIRDKFDQRFKDAQVYRDPNQWPEWRGLLGDSVGREGQE